jgi:tripartite-type tricarboxylate transporter receptor subunit TctC
VLKEIKAQLLAQGLDPKPTSTGELNKFISKDKDKWAKVVKDSNAKN